MKPKGTRPAAPLPLSVPLTLSVLLALAALSWGPRQRQAGELVVVYKSLPLTLVPHLKLEVVTSSVQSNIFEGLVGFSPDMRIIPLLAERWENPDELTWIFNIRRGVKFHDNSLLDCEDVIYSLQRAREPRSPISSDFVAVDSIIKVDGDKVKIKTARPYPILLNKLINALIIPRDYRETAGDGGFAKAPAGTGCYRFESLTPGKTLTLAAWDKYWGARPAFRKMKIVASSETAEALKLLSEVPACLVTKLSPESARQIESRARSGIRVIREKGLTLRYLGLNTRAKPYDNSKVRQALALAVDRKRLVDEILLGYGAPANQLVPQAVFGHCPGLPDFRYDPGRAKKLLAAAGYPRGIELTLLLRERHRSLAEELQRQMAPAGIRLRFKIMEQEDFMAALKTSSFSLVGSVSTSGDVSDQFDDVIHSPVKGYGRANNGHFRNSRIDRLIEASYGYLDQGKRLAALQEIMALVMKDPPRIPLFFEDEIYAVSGSLEWQPRADMTVLGQDVKPGAK